MSYLNYNYDDGNACHVSRYILEPILAVLEKQPGKRTILDVGCGNGWLVEELLKRDYDAYGIDASESGIQQAELKTKGRFFTVNAESGKLPESLDGIVFNTIISTEVIEHLYDPRAYLVFCKEILERCTADKTFIITTPYHGYLKNLFLAVTGKMDAHFTALWDGGHIKFWSRETLTKLLKENGFNPKEFRGCGRFPYLWKSMLISSQL